MDINNIKIKVEDLSDNYGKFIIEPLEKGYGVTLGNSLRRTLLSSMWGAAATAIRIEGITHEFDTITGVKEDVIEIILNIKELVVKIFADEPQILKLKAKGKKTVTAADITPNINVEILNPDLKIATLSGHAKLDMEIVVEKGMGYFLAEKNKKSSQSVDTIFIDSYFSPITKVRYDVETASLSQFSNYEKLTLEIFTNKSLLPDEALSKSANILIKYLKIFTKFSPEDVELEGELISREEKENNEKEKILNKSIEELDFSVRSYNCLKKSNINTLRDLVDYSPIEVIKIKNLGKKSLDEIKEKITKYGFVLGEKMHQEDF
ncbi:DNA-directed RNA polymerase subunit alpha [Candidatus Atribacteria bacterium RBG_19FT_COMBO_35_14]|uniref:DNA-directed RNA polymerase subunit alpha n=1 Tax=Candidatus Sediminicultor quintus TaxID=1797291 RepID=A0A1F5AGL8_9BACT|nr:MAG: DNA-directed RNA polymerase subunit alpha [Candidatus Atribacteria bacterium RBG_19FT_COMBO_35_14]